MKHRKIKLTSVLIASAILIGSSIFLVGTSCSGNPAKNQATNVSFSGDGIVYDGDNGIPNAKHIQSPIGKPGDLYYNATFMDSNDEHDSVQDPIGDIQQSQIKSSEGLILSQKGNSLHVTWPRNVVQLIPTTSFIIDAYVKSRSNPNLSKEVIANIDFYEIEGVYVSVPGGKMLGHKGLFTTESTVDVTATNNNTVGTEGIGYSVTTKNGLSLPNGIHGHTTSGDDNNLTVEGDYTVHKPEEIDIYINAGSLANDDKKISPLKVTIIADAADEITISGPTSIETKPQDGTITKTYTATYTDAADIESGETLGTVKSDGAPIPGITIQETSNSTTASTATLTIDASTVAPKLYSLIITASNNEYELETHNTISLNAHGNVQKIDIDPGDGATFFNQGGSNYAVQDYVPTVVGANVMTDIHGTGAVISVKDNATLSTADYGGFLKVTVSAQGIVNAGLQFSITATSVQDPDISKTITGTGYVNTIQP